MGAKLVAVVCAEQLYAERLQRYIQEDAKDSAENTSPVAATIGWPTCGSKALRNDAAEEPPCPPWSRKCLVSTPLKSAGLGGVDNLMMPAPTSLYCFYNHSIVIPLQQLAVRQVTCEDLPAYVTQADLVRSLAVSDAAIRLAPSP